MPRGFCVSFSIGTQVIFIYPNHNPSIQLYCTTFVGARHFTPLARLVAGDGYPSEEKIRRLRAPVLFFHGDRDEIVPYELGQKLHKAAPEPKAFETLANAGHNDTVAVGGAPYFERIGAFLDEVAPISNR